MCGCGRRARLRASRRARPRRAAARLRSYPHPAAIAGHSSIQSQAPPGGAHARSPTPRRESGPSFDALDKDLDLAAAGEADFPGLLVGDAEIEEARLAVADRLQGLGDDRALDAAARDRADKGAVAVDGELGAQRAGRGAPSIDNRRERDAFARFAPARRLFQDFRGIAHVLALNIPLEARSVPGPSRRRFGVAPRR